MKQHKSSNSGGFSHHFLLPVLAILLVGGIGGYVMLRSSSAAVVEKDAVFDAPRSASYSADIKAVTKCKSKKIREGSEGSCVTTAQKILNTWGQVTQLTVSGKFDQTTQATVKLFQESHKDTSGKKLAVDGVIGEKTWAALKKSIVSGEIGGTLRYSICTYKYDGKNADKTKRVSTYNPAAVKKAPVGMECGPDKTTYSTKLATGHSDNKIRLERMVGLDLSRWDQWKIANSDSMEICSYKYEKSSYVAAQNPPEKYTCATGQVFNSQKEAVAKKNDALKKKYDADYKKWADYIKKTTVKKVSFEVCSYAYASSTYDPAKVKKAPSKYACGPKQVYETDTDAVSKKNDTIRTKYNADYQKWLTYAKSTEKNN